VAGSLARPARPGKLDSIAGAGVLANRAVRLVAAVIKGNDTLLMKAYGRADVEWGVPKPRFPRDSAYSLIELQPFQFRGRGAGL